MRMLSLNTTYEVASPRVSLTSGKPGGDQFRNRVAITTMKGAIAPKEIRE
jgi:hypothetical protein